MQDMYELKLGLSRGCGATSINNWDIPLLYRLCVYHGEPAVNLHIGIKSFDDGASCNSFLEEDELLGMLNCLQDPIEHEEKIEEGWEE